MMNRMASVQVTVSPEEKAALEAQAAAEGVTVSLLVYRRAFNKPDAQIKRGRRPKHAPSQPERLFDKTG
jgi:hypothetical protein